MESAKIQLGLSLILKDGKKAMQAWNLYYQIPDGKKATGILTLPQEKLSEIFSNWNKDDLNQIDRDKLILNLAASRFYQLASLMNKYLPNNLSTENPIITDICSYYKFCERIEERVYKYYKDITVKNENNISLLKKDIDIIQEDLWDKINWQGKKPKYSKKKFYEELFNRFGVKFFMKELNDRYFYIGGHNIMDTKKVVEQFGKKAEIQFAVLDHRFSNNYWGWFTGYLGFAGYTDGSEIVRYREPEASNSIHYWNKLTKNELLNTWQKEISEQTIKDNSLALKGNYTDLKGIYNRIQLKTYSGILDSLKESVVKDDLRIHFISELNEITYSRNIHHEGRHAIDFNNLPKAKLGNDTELEYRAMLSEIYFSKYPLLQIRFDCDNTPHGRAREKILLDITKWMDLNKEKINGFDNKQPTITQIDLLTNNQLKEIIRSVEPFLN